MVQETLSQYDIDVPIIVYKGKVFRRVIRSEQSYLTGVGKISLESTLYRADGYCICPLEEQKEYKKAKDKAFYREASCAAINFYDADGERLKTVRFGRMPEAGKKTLKQLIQTSINTIVSKQPDINIIKIADGALDNGRFLSEQLLPECGIEVLDYFHASYINNCLLFPG